MHSGRLVEALLPVSALRAVAADSAVAGVRPPDVMVPQAVDEGVALSGADVWHTAGIDGSGVKVAIIDAGFAGYSSLLGSALPASVVTDDRCGGHLATPVASGGTDHGTAVAELVHQMAPGAELYLICVDSEVGLALAEQDASADGVKIINESLAWFGPSVGRGDGTGGAGSPDAVVAQARADGILWVNAAGNYGQDHWGGTFWPDPSDPSLNDFNSGVPYDAVTIASGEQSCVVLTWDDWPVTTEDLDLGLVNDTSGHLVAASTNDQSSGLAAPEEDLCYTNTGATQVFDIVVVNYNAVGSPHLDLTYTGAAPLAYSNSGGVVDPASSPDALAVGAACWASPLDEPYSSKGPTVDGRTEPGLRAADNVSTATYGNSDGSCNGSAGFAGTSAASPQVAGGAALLLQHDPSLNVGGLTATLEFRAGTNYFSGELRLGPLSQPGTIAMSDQGGDIGVFDNAYTTILPHFSQFPVWSADGSRINFDLSSYLGSPAGFASVKADGSDQQIVSGSPTSVLTADWSADGSKVAYVAPTHSPTGIWVYDVATGISTEVLTDATARGPQWSPDGSKIAYLSGSGGAQDVWVMNADGGDPHALTSLGTVGGQLGWSPDGSEIAYSAGNNSPGIWLVGADGSDPHRITNGTLYGGLAWSPDGKRIAFLSAYDSYIVIKTVNADGTSEQILFAPNNAANWLSWTSVTESFVVSNPSLSGTPQVGEALAATPGAGSMGTSSATFSYKWYRCDSGGANCGVIAGQTGPSYTATSNDIGSTLKVETAATDGTHSGAARSAASAAVLPAPPHPTAMPTITGTAQVGHTLSMSFHGGWSAPVTRSYQWLNCDSTGGACFAIANATSTSYVVKTQDIGDTLRLAVKAIGAGGTSYLSSKPSTVVPTLKKLTVSRTGAGSGTVTSSPAGINCGSTCVFSFSTGTNVVLTATAHTGSAFTGWTGACTGSGLCTVTMSAAKTVTAAFATRPAQTLKVSRAGSGSGTVTSSPSGINCGSTCSHAYAFGTPVTLAATPTSSASVFVGWSGACTGTAKTCHVSMTGARSAIATFAVAKTLTVTKSGTGSGNVVSSPAGISCGAACTHSFAAGTKVTLTASASSGSTFAGWSGACSGTGNCVVTMSAAKAVKATFTTTAAAHPTALSKHPRLNR